ncbi:MFS transporter [Brevibacillus sp. NRS-1366]|uniref:MFS transporter n=1 Tax=Brevibacillus sp. NRS-1366 TaxID=3233899 RepID=UPI003D1D68AE
MNNKWYKGVTKDQWRTFSAAYLGWMLDIMDLMLYSMVIVYIIQDIGLTKSVAGMIASATLFASAFGGVIFGFIADRWGRAKSMFISILVYSIATFFCGFSETATQLMILRILVGIGIGGEWATGATLIMETWPPQKRNIAMAFVQSAFAVGYAVAALITSFVVPEFGWRGVFFVGVFPALIGLWIRKHTPEPDVWKEQEKRLSFRETMGTIITSHGKSALICVLFGSFSLLGFFGLATWLPAYLSSPVSEGGQGMDIVKTSNWIIVSQLGAFFGYIGFGFIANKIGRKTSFILFLSISALSVPVYLLIKEATILLFFGAFVSFFVNGFYAGFGPFFSSLFPTSIRGTALGTVYNVARGVSAFAPFIIGQAAMSRGLGTALMVTSGFYVLAILILVLFVKESVSGKTDMHADYNIASTSK